MIYIKIDLSPKRRTLSDRSKNRNKGSKISAAINETINCLNLRKIILFIYAIIYGLLCDYNKKQGALRVIQIKMKRI